MSEPCTVTAFGAVHSHGIGQPCVKRGDERRFKLQAWLEERMARAYARHDDNRGDAWRGLANLLD